MEKKRQNSVKCILFMGFFTEKKGNNSMEIPCHLATLLGKWQEALYVGCYWWMSQ
jgi:hypothetical protein